MEYKRWSDKERKKHKKVEEEKIRSIRTEEEAWKYINKFRKKKEGVDEDIEFKNWKKHFMELLGGVKEKVIMEEEAEKREEEKAEKDGEEKEEITRKELINQLRRLKKAKAPGENGIENEAWRLMSREIEEAFLELLNKIWKEIVIPQE